MSGDIYDPISRVADYWTRPRYYDYTPKQKKANGWFDYNDWHFETAREPILTNGELRAKMMIPLWRTTRFVLDTLSTPTWNYWNEKYRSLTTAIEANRDLMRSIRDTPTAFSQKMIQLL